MKEFTTVVKKNLPKTFKAFVKYIKANYALSEVSINDNACRVEYFIKGKKLDAYKSSFRFWMAQGEFGAEYTIVVQGPRSMKLHRVGDTKAGDSFLKSMNVAVK
jgi:hypothetical protein